MAKAKRTLGTSIALAAIAFGSATQPALAQNYLVKDLGPLYREEHSRGSAINSWGQVVGLSSYGDTGIRAMSWDGASKVNLGTVPGYTWKSGALGVNNLGFAVGYATSGAGAEPVSHAVLFSPTGNIDLGTLGGATSSAHAINDQGQVVGRASGGGGSYAFIWQDANHNGISDPGEMQKLSPMLMGWNSESGAYGINEYGQVAGWAQAITGYSHAVLVTGGVAKDLGTLGGDWSFAYAVNSNGNVVGEAQNSALNYRAFKYGRRFVTNRGVGYWMDILLNLGVLPGFKHSAAFSMNNSGDAVGKSGNFRGEIHQTDRAVIFKDAGPVNLNTRIPLGTGWTLLEARGINDGGQITGVGLLNGKLHGYLLSPIGRP